MLTSSSILATTSDKSRTEKQGLQSQHKPLIYFWIGQDRMEIYMPSETSHMESPWPTKQYSLDRPILQLLCNYFFQTYIFIFIS